ncbi:MAG TPA: nuclear transport factor 2 family protein [bacterium]|nr:nuclear transport factor 2 family protein [bacterium]
MLPDAKKFANEWIGLWNSHNIEKILEHYSEEFEITTPMIKVALGIETGMLKGKKKIRNYWNEALKKIPDLKFELIEVAKSIDTIAIYYKSVMNKMAIEVMFFDESAKITKVIAHYN